uniref:Phosphodiesterase 2A n=1 Tax=Electrophorus electricus TaxID=8005 RepID=A0A4W4EA61_ELEEL
MVLFLQHALIALVYFFRRGQQVFLRAEEPPVFPPPSSWDALLRLASIVDANSLRVAIKETLGAVLPKVESVFVYLLEAECRMRCEDPPHELCADGKLR